MRLNGSSKNVERIKLHLMFGNYAILDHANTQEMHHEIANLLKSIMIEFTKPVCPYTVFENDLLPNIDEIVLQDDGKKMDFIVDLVVRKIAPTSG
jgi:hypothetical protein